MWEWISQKTRTTPGWSKRTERDWPRDSAEVEALRLREGEHVVVDAIGVREVDGAPHGDREDVGHEGLVFWLRVARPGRGASNAAWGAVSR